MFLRKLLDGNTPVEEQDLNYVSSASAAVLQQSPRGAQALLIFVLLCVVFFIIWASVAEVDEFTRGEGRVIPSQQVQIIQNLEGGILDELFVSEGQHVERGQALLRIDDTRFSSSLREADVTLHQLELKTVRLKAEANATPFDPQVNEHWSATMVAQEFELHNSRIEELNSSKGVLSQQVNQKQQELSELEAKRAQLSRSLNFLEQELIKMREAALGGAISDIELLRMERQYNDMKGELEASELAIPRAQSSLNEVREKLANADLSFRREAREELNQVVLELNKLSESSQALADRVERTLVRSPVAGTVKRFMVNTIGGVIQPGMDIAEIVPSEEVLLVEAKIRPADIAYLHPGQRANIRFSAYDFAVMGGMEGKLVHLSPDTIEDEKGERYYLVRVQTQGAFNSADGTELPIIAGMTVSVDVLTGKKSILSYLLKPILKTKQLALRER